MIETIPTMDGGALAAAIGVTLLVLFLLVMSVVAFVGDDPLLGFGFALLVLFFGVVAFFCWTHTWGSEYRITDTVADSVANVLVLENVPGFVEIQPAVFGEFLETGDEVVLLCDKTEDRYICVLEEIE